MCELHILPLPDKFDIYKLCDRFSSCVHRRTRKTITRDSFYGAVWLSNRKCTQAWDETHGVGICTPVLFLILTLPRFIFFLPHYRFVCLSDTHNMTDSLNVPDGDVLLHAGDFSNVGEIQDIEKFCAFLDRLPHRHKVVIAGNHDLSFDEGHIDQLRQRFRGHSRLDDIDPKAVKDMLREHCTYLEDEETEVLGYWIYGSPWWGNNNLRHTNLSSMM